MPHTSPDREPGLHGSDDFADSETAPKEWQLKTTDSITDARDLFDNLENEGVQQKEFVVLGNSSFVVRWKTNEVLTA